MAIGRTPILVLGVSLLLFAGGCARYASYEHYRPTPVEMAQMRASYEELVARREDARARGEQPLPPAPRADKVKINPTLSYQVTDQDAVAPVSLSPV